jgi:antitoxin component YwqK of YwqJK toxin-antitoxin module
MNPVFALLFLMLPLSILSQKDKSPKNGKAVFYYPSENNQKIIKSTGLNEKGLTTGEWLFFHPNGQLDYTQEFDKGIPKGFRKTFLKDVLIYEEHFEDSLLNGQQNYFDENGHLLARYFFNQGKMDSVHFFYPENQKPYVQKVYQGKSIVIRREYFPTGELKSLSNYNVNYQFHGLQLNYKIEAETGIYYLSSKKNYKEGQLNGEFYEASVLGPTTHCFYKMNKYDGRYTSYYTNGQIDYEVTYIDDVKTGKGIDYFKNGVIQREEYWTGKMDQWNTSVFDSMFYYLDNGNLYISTAVKQLNNEVAEMHFKTYHANSEIESIFKEINGNKEGLYLKYHSNGNLERQLTYSKNDVTGQALFWYDNGKKKFDLTIENSVVIKQKGWTSTGQPLEVKDKRYRDLYEALEFFYVENPELDKYRPDIKDLMMEIKKDQEGNGYGDGGYEVIEEVPENYNFTGKIRTEAKFPGKSHELEDFINRTKRVPEGEKNRQTWVVVNASFTVEADGSISAIQLANYSGNPEVFPLFSVETKRILSLMPNWIPATDFDGKNVPSNRKVNFYF